MPAHVRSDVRHLLPAELGDAHPRVEQDVECFVVSAVVIIVSYEFQELAHLIFCDGLSRHTVVDYHPGKLKTEWVLLEHIIVDRHLEGGSEHTPHCFDAAVPFAVSLHFDQKQLRVRSFDVTDPLPAEILLIQKVQYEFVVRGCAGLCSGPGGQVSAVQDSQRFSYQTQLSLLLQIANIVDVDDPLLYSECAF